MTMVNFSEESCSKSLKLRNNKSGITQNSKLSEGDLKHKYLIEDIKSPAFFPGF